MRTKPYNWWQYQPGLIGPARERPIDGIIVVKNHPPWSELGPATIVLEVNPCVFMLKSAAEIGRKISDSLYVTSYGNGATGLYYYGGIGSIGTEFTSSIKLYIESTGAESTDVYVFASEVANRLVPLLHIARVILVDTSPKGTGPQ